MQKMQAERVLGAGGAIAGRELARAELQRIWEIDRREVIDNIYYHEGGRLVLKPEHYDVQGWPPGEAELYTPLLLDAFDRGGWFYGLFDGEQLIAAVSLESKLIGPHKDLLQLKQLHVSCAYRGRRLGKRLFEMAKDKARSREANGLYVSATPSEHTVDFYLRLGCTLFASTPSCAGVEDIHLGQVAGREQMSS
jgi:predicted N-acetyltransferase YhbS